MLVLLMLLFNTSFGTLQFSSWPACWLLISGNTICHYIEVWFVLWFILWTGLCFLSDILYLSRAALLKCNHPCTLLCQFYDTWLIGWLVTLRRQVGWNATCYGIGMFVWTSFTLCLMQSCFFSSQVIHFNAFVTVLFLSALGAVV